MVLGAGTSLFAVLFTIYFFNLDMKVTAYIADPILQKHYDKIPRNAHL